jgi:hypothetical protein
MKILICVSLLAAFGALAGCGGSSGSNTASNSPSNLLNSESRSVSASAGAEPNSTNAAITMRSMTITVSGVNHAKSAFDHAWLIVHKIEGVAKDESIFTLFENRDGEPMDLLASESLSGAGLSDAITKPLTRLKITVAPTALFFAPGQNQAKNIGLSKLLPKDGDGNLIVSLTLTKPIDLKNPIAIVADLEKLIVTDNTAAVALSIGESPKSLPSQTLFGIIQSASETGVMLGLPGGRRLSVPIDALTSVVQADGSSNPKLAEGTAVAAILSNHKATQLVLGALSVAIAEGSVSDLEASNGSLILTPKRLKGIVPTQARLLVTIDESAVLRSQGGLILTREAFLAALKDQSTAIRVSGTLEPATGALIAKQAWLVSGQSIVTSISGSVRGVASFDEKTGSFVIKAPTDYDGFLPSSKGTVILINTATVCTDEKGEALTLDALKTQLAEKSLRVIGTIDTLGKLTASKLSLADALPKATAPEVKITPDLKAAAPEVKPPARTDG